MIVAMGLLKLPFVLVRGEQAGAVGSPEKVGLEPPGKLPENTAAHEGSGVNGGQNMSRASLVGE